MHIILKVKVKLLSCVWLFATPRTVAYQASLSMGFSRQKYWSGLLFPSPGDLPDPGIEPRSPVNWPTTWFSLSLVSISRLLWHLYSSEYWHLPFTKFFDHIFVSVKKSYMHIKYICLLYNYKWHAFTTLLIFIHIAYRHKIIETKTRRMKEK